MSQFRVMTDNLPYTAEELAALKEAHACSPAEKILAAVLLTVFWTALVLAVAGIA